MKVPLRWLREYCDPPLDGAAVEQRLTMTGTKVEALHEQLIGTPERFLLGRVLEVEPHPDADRLTICRVDLGPSAGEGPATIVCGAPNVAGGQLVAVARPGALMPDGSELGARKLRGVLSEGMILSDSELGLGAGSDGILVLDDIGAHCNDGQPPPGTRLERLLELWSEVLELEITPNRPDCLGVWGIARELHAATGAPLSPEPWASDPGTLSPQAGGSLDHVSVAVECHELCRRFTARVFENVQIAPSPPWLRARLAAAGQRPINNVVDVTNYAMLLTGQPLHAFDLDRVAGARLVVRRAREGEHVHTLDGHTRALDEQMVLIEDGDGPTSIAGVMGGARSEVQPGTTRVLLEAATWSGPNIHRTSWSLGLRSEASSRFEKGLQPEQCMHAQALATRMLIECAGASVAPGTIDLAWEPDPERVLRLRESRVHAILGVPVTRERQAQILAALDFPAAPAPDGLDATVPALRRGDVTREIDLIEEVARIDGLERLPASMPARRGASGWLSHAQRVRRAAEDAMVGRGLHEIAGWSFADPQLLERLRLAPDDDMREVVTLSNPMSRAQSIMRPTLLGSLLDAAQHNVSRNGPDVAIFESGTVFRAARGAAQPLEHHALGVLLSGALAPRSWRGAPAQADFFSAKALLEALLAQLRVSWSIHAHDRPFLHPGRAAAIHAETPDASVGAEAGAEAGRVGFLGELHPLVAANWDLEHASAFVLDLGMLAAASPRDLAFRAFASVPPLRQDLAVTLPEDVAAATVLECVRKAAGELLADVTVFDVYSGDQLLAGRRSLALSLCFRAPDRTLTDADVEPLRARIVGALAGLGGELRG